MTIPEIHQEIAFIEEQIRDPFPTSASRLSYRIRLDWLRQELSRREEIGKSFVDLYNRLGFDNPSL